MAGASGQELVRHAIQTLHSPTQAVTPQTGAGDDSVLPSYMSGATPTAKMEVEDLVSMAFKEGIAKATSAAQRSNPFILDAFHDALAGKLHEELKKRKLV